MVEILRLTPNSYYFLIKYIDILLASPEALFLLLNLQHSIEFI